MRGTRSRKPKTHYLLTVRDWKAASEHPVEDWRWKAKRAIRVDRKLGAQVPTQMREGVEAYSKAHGLNLSEVQRRALHKFLKEAAEGT